MKDKVVWITGASSGIGAACAKEYHKLGSKIILSARSTDKLRALKEELQGSVEILEMDVSQTDLADQKCKEAEQFFGPVDIFINNAGISQRGYVEHTSLDVDRRIFEVNFFGNIALTKALLPSMLARETGNIVVISSVAGKLSTPGRSSYSGSKHALHGFYDALRAEVSDRNVGVNVICPGYIKTDISINALNPKGEKHGVMDSGQDQGMSAEECARQIVSAVQKNKKECFIGAREARIAFVRRIFPSIYYKLLTKMAKERRFKSSSDDHK